MKKVTDKAQLIFCNIYSLILVLIFSISIFKKSSDGTRYSFFSIMNKLSYSGITLWCATFILIFIVLVLSYVQSFITHKKNGYTIIKELTCLSAMIILMFEVKMVNHVTLFNAKLVTINYWIIVVCSIIYPVFLYLIDYIDSILNAK